MSEQKPREWILNLRDNIINDTHMVEYELGIPPTREQLCYVIEKSAFDAVVTERDGLSAMLAVQSSGATIDALIRERDQLKKLLDLEKEAHWKTAGAYRRAIAMKEKLAVALKIPVEKRNGMNQEDFEAMEKALDDYNNEFKLKD